MQPLRDHSEKFIDSQYKANLAILFGHYSKLRQKVPINVPDIIHPAEDPKTLEILCGYLCLTSFFTKDQL